MLMLITPANVNQLGILKKESKETYSKYAAISWLEIIDDTRKT